MSKSELKSKSYTLKGEHGQWLGQIVLTSDGMFASVTDYGNLSYAWRSFGNEDFRRFISGLDVAYFAQKMVNGMAYIAHDKKTQRACQRFAEMILPPLKEVLKKEIEQGIDW
jgi:hypothetical protein